MALSKYRLAQYKDGGRENGVYDCWGLVREVAHEVYGMPLFNSYGDIAAENKRLMTRAAVEVARNLTECKRREGTLAAAYTNGLIIHVGIVVRIDGLIKILHATSKHGIVFASISQFERIAGKEIKYYEYT
jgi:cell wall-associated NlpC family hydrolase